MRAGTLNKRVMIQEKVVTRNSFGEEEVSWTPIAEVWAAVEPLAGREFFEARQVQSEITTRVRMRYGREIAEVISRPDMRVVYAAEERTLTYDVDSVVHRFEGKRELHLMCREVVQ